MTDTTDRDRHRQDLRDQSTQLVLVVPYTEGEVGHALGRLEELLLALGDVDDEEPLPAPFANREAADALGRLASFVAGLERDHPPTQPLAPDGRYELVPLLFVPLGRLDRARIVAAATQLVDAGAAKRGPLHELVAEFAGDGNEAATLLDIARRLMALLEMPWDTDTDLLNARLGRLGVNGPTERIVLTAGELEAYQRVTQRILAAWHANDPLQRFIYAGGALTPPPPVA